MPDQLYSEGIKEAPGDLSHRLDEDILFSIPRGRAAQFAMDMVHPVQGERGESILAGVAVLFATMATRYNRSPQDLYQYGMRILEANEPFKKLPNAQVEALKDFAKLKVNRRPAI